MKIWSENSAVVIWFKSTEFTITSFTTTLQSQTSFIFHLRLLLHKVSLVRNSINIWNLWLALRATVKALLNQIKTWLRNEITLCAVTVWHPPFCSLSFLLIYSEMKSHLPLVGDNVAQMFCCSSCRGQECAEKLQGGRPDLEEAWNGRPDQQLLLVWQGHTWMSHAWIICGSHTHKYQLRCWLSILTTGLGAAAMDATLIYLTFHKCLTTSDLVKVFWSIWD